ncbi:hypothetical protein N7510_005212 [Penicillium lagena]|uniref:uncharacterized protein n=1 Tax=Penicillium lagena TaxID=94218 RepID=UPI0025422FE2|nr:uncharacterized protein N7510_005212 [Penicillium lagena]KAJ5612018.1 hypothetical protein N7510_005212 [Penicillium lagena]
MPLPKATLVIVSGAFHDQDMFEPAIPWLCRTGHPLDFNVKLPSVGNNSASSLQEDADAIRNRVLDVLDNVDGGNNVVMVLFSYGAVPAVQGLVGLDQKTRESHLEQFGNWAKLQDLTADPPVEFKDGVAIFIAGPDIFYNGLDEEIKAHFYTKLKTQSAALVFPLDLSLLDPITQAAYLDIPSWYLVTKLDNNMPRDFQILCTKVIGEKLENVEEIETGHSSFWIRPDLVVDYILRGARSAEKGLS